MRYVPHHPNETRPSPLVEVTYEQSYSNPAGRPVTTTFRGLADLDVIHDPLEHGAELFFSERVGVPQQELEKLVSSKDRLSVFRPTEQTAGPDDSSGEVLAEVERLIRGDRKRDSAGED